MAGAAGQGGDLQRALVVAPITALAFLEVDGDCLVLAGEDTELRVYAADSGRLCGSVRVFDEQSIHGTRVGTDGSVLIWGGPLVTVLPSAVVKDLAASSSGQIRSGRFNVARAPDWIYDGATSPWEPGQCVLVTAHNEALELSVLNDGQSLDFGTVASPSRPILYSANLMWTSENEVLIAGGTVIGEILVWKCRLGQPIASPQLLFIFEGHEGSIFGVHISSEISLGNNIKGRLLASCSDDRTIRVWDITERSTAHTVSKYRHGLAEVRETGFPDTEKATSSKDTPEPLALAMGHISRIWLVMFVMPGASSAQDAGISIYSFGEDATAQKWDLELDAAKWRASLADTTLSGPPVKLVHQRTVAYHEGKNIWSTALAQQHGGQYVIATGGADGKISIVNRTDSGNTEPTKSQKPTSPKNIHHALTVHDVLQTLPTAEEARRPASQVRDTFRRFAFMSQDEFLAATGCGRLFLGCFSNDLTWSEVTLSEVPAYDLRAGTVIKSPGPGLALLGTANGRIYIYHQGEVRYVAAICKKVTDLFPLKRVNLRDDARSTRTTEVLVTSLGNVMSLVLILDEESGEMEDSRSVSGLDSRFIVTSATIVGHFAVLGSRNGYIALLDGQGGDYEARLHYKTTSVDAITTILPLPEQQSSLSSLFLTTSRDGRYRIYSIHNQPSEPNLSLLHETSPQFSPLIEAAWLAPSQGANLVPDLILGGFKSTNFIVWNETQQQELASIPCGGGHRAFALTQSPTNPEWLRFAYTKASKLCVYSQTCAPHQALKSSLHGREIRSVAWNGRYLATGSESTLIRIWELPAGETASGGLCCVANIKVHSTGIQHLKWCGEYLFSSGGNDEFFVWRTRRLDRFAGLAVAQEGTFDDLSANCDLRITSFDVAQTNGNGEGVFFCITMAFSNSVLKTYRYADGEFEALASGRYTGACLTQARQIDVQEGAFRVLTASTDGHLALWHAVGDTSSNTTVAVYKPTLITKIHQSAIKSLDVKLPSSDSPNLIVITGGDDNAVGITILDCSENEPLVLGRMAVESAHAAAINGIAIWGSDGTNTFVATVSNDQRVKTWRFTETTSVALLSDQYSGIADAGDVEIVEERRQIVVAGVGLEIWHLDGERSSI